MASRPHILFTATFHSSFIDRDIQILREGFSVTALFSKGWAAPLQFIRHLPSIDITFSWFASVYSSLLVFLARIFRLKSIIVLGGVDVARETELDYGIWNSWWKSRVVRYGITHASAVLAVDESLRRDAMRLAHYGGENISVVPTGYDAQYWLPSGKKEQYILTVAQCRDMTRVKLKGIDVFLSIARSSPDLKFIAIGIDDLTSERLNIPPNVECIEFSPPEVLLGFYQSAKVYCQLSYREGLPNSLCEAMLCECVPVGTNVGGIPTAVGDTGFIVPYNDIMQTKEAIYGALTSEPGRGHRARLRIASRYTLSQREDSLRKTIMDLTQ